MKTDPSVLRQILARKQKSPKKASSRPPKWFFPTSQEREYMRDLWSLTDHMKWLIKEFLIPQIPQMIREVQVFTPDRADDYLSRLRQIIEFLTRKMIPQVNETILFAEDEGIQINRYNKSQFEKINRSVFGFDIFQNEPWLEDQLKLFASQNAELIRSLASAELERVAGIVERGLQQGENFQTISTEIQKSFGISHRRAKLIARDQTTKLNASLTKLRQQELGIEEYEWQTSGDERVRPTHKANDGKRFKWSKPPPKTGHPGHDVNCRCVALPVLEGLLDIKMGHP